MKALYFKTNYNNKLACNAFVHIDKAPAQSIPEKKLNELFEIRTADNSHPPVKATLYALTRMKLGQMADCFSLPSHSMDAAEFITWWQQQNKDDSFSVELAVYYYKRQE